MAARRKRKRPPPGRDVPGPFARAVALLTLRLFAGGFFLVTAGWKLVEPGYSVFEKITAFREHEYVPFIERAVAHPPRVLGVELGAFADFLEGVMLPAAPVAAPAVLLFEALLGLALVLGAGVRLFAALGFALMLVFSLGKPQPGQGEAEPVGVFLFTVHSANWPLTWILLALACLAAGRVLGLDARLRRSRAPGWVRALG